MSQSMRYAICNETFADWEHARVCEFVAEVGYGGLEIAPFTLGPQPTTLDANARRDWRRTAERAGLRLIGLHWLLAKTSGYHLTAPDPAVQIRTAAYLGDLARLCADLGGDLLVLGSPQQRHLPPHISPAEGFEYARATLTRLVPTLEATRVRLCLEPLGPAETNFLNTGAEALQLMATIGHPLVTLHLDVKALASEVPTQDDGMAVAALIRRYGRQAAHFHANDPNRRGPGDGPMPFAPIQAALRDVEYAGWISVEVFDYAPDPATIARRSLATLRAAEAVS